MDCETVSKPRVNVRLTEQKSAYTCDDSTIVHTMAMGSSEEILLHEI